MSGQDHEWLSAYLDDEISPAERARGSRELSRNPSARRLMGRYQLIGDAIREDLPEHLDLGLAQRVHQAIVREGVTPPTHPILQEFWHWLRHPAPLATASGVLGLVVAGWLWVYTQGSYTDAPMVEAPIGYTASVDEQQQIMSYLAAHAEVEPRALMPYIHLVDYEK